MNVGSTVPSLMGAVFLLPMIVVLSIVVLLGEEQDIATADVQCSVSSEVANTPSGPVGDYSGEQLENAALIMETADDLNLSVKAQTIGVMTAMGESSLRVLDKGDAAGSDSRGLFQQRDNGAWGSFEDRMDPATSATIFLRPSRTWPVGNPRNQPSPRIRSKPTRIPTTTSGIGGLPLKSSPPLRTLRW